MSKDDSKFLSIKGWLIPVRATIEKSDGPLFFPLYLTLGSSLKAFLHSALVWFPCQSPGTLFLGKENSPSFISSGWGRGGLLAPTVALDINAIPVMEKGKQLSPNTGCFFLHAHPTGLDISGCPVSMSPHGLHLCPLGLRPQAWLSSMPGPAWQTVRPTKCF